MTGSVDVNVPGELHAHLQRHQRVLRRPTSRARSASGTPIAPAIGELPGHAGSALAGRSPAGGRAARLCGHRCERQRRRAVPPCRSNEPANGPGDGNTPIDWIVVDATHVQLRAERTGGGRGRTYTVTCHLPGPGRQHRAPGPERVRTEVALRRGPRSGHRSEPRSRNAHRESRTADPEPGAREPDLEPGTWRPV